MNPTGDLTLDTLRIYEEEYQSFLDRWGKGAYVPPPLLLEFIEGLPAQSTILDLACGPGQDTRFLRREGFKAVGLDLSSRLLEWAREQSSQTPLIRADMRRLPLQKNRFDAVWSAAGLVHLTKADFGSLLKAIRLTMRTGGRFGGTFTFGTRSGPLKGSWLPGRYFSRWQKGELARMVRGAGFVLEGLEVVSNRERKGRWLNLIARKREGPNPRFKRVPAKIRSGRTR